MPAGDQAAETLADHGIVEQDYMAVASEAQVGLDTGYASIEGRLERRQGVFRLQPAGAAMALQVEAFPYHGRNSAPGTKIPAGQPDGQPAGTRQERGRWQDGVRAFHFAFPNFPRCGPHVKRQVELGGAKKPGFLKKPGFWVSVKRQVEAREWILARYRVE